jgi:hypothetical protein
MRALVRKHHGQRILRGLAVLQKSSPGSRWLVPAIGRKQDVDAGDKRDMTRKRQRLNHV